MAENDEKSVQLQLNLSDPLEQESLLAENMQLRDQYAMALAEIERLKLLIHAMKNV